MDEFYEQPEGHLVKSVYMNELLRGLDFPDTELKSARRIQSKLIILKSFEG